MTSALFRSGGLAFRGVLLPTEEVPLAVVLPVTVFSLAWTDLWLALVAIPVGGLAGLLAWWQLRRLGAALLAAGVAPILITDTAMGVFIVAALALLVAAERWRTPLVLALAAPLGLLPPEAAGVGVVFLAAVLGGRSDATAPASWAGRWDARWVYVPLALAMLAVAVLGGVAVWVAVLALGGGAASRVFSRQPANYRVGQTFLAGGIAAAMSPAAAGFLLASIDRLPKTANIPTLLGSWGLVALGGSAVFVGLGIDTAFRATGRLEERWVPPLLLGLGWSIGAAVQGDLDTVRTVMGFALALLAPPIVAGARRAVALGARPWLTNLAVAVVVLSLLPLRAVL